MDINIVRAWKDEEYRNSLTDAQRAALPSNPAGERLTEVSEDDLQHVTGADVGCGYVCSVSADCWGFRCDIWNRLQ